MGRQRTLLIIFLLLVTAILFSCKTTLVEQYITDTVMEQEEAPYEEQFIPEEETEDIETPVFDISEDDSVKIRAASLNANNFTSDKSGDNHNFTHKDLKNTKENWKVIFEIMDRNGIDIMAVQEIYLKSEWDTNKNAYVDNRKDHPVAKLDKKTWNTGEGKYKVLLGPGHIHEWETSQGTGDKYKQEYCPIIFNMETIHCDRSKIIATVQPRKLHLARCRSVEKRKKTHAETYFNFTFGCTHFAYKNNDGFVMSGEEGAITVNIATISKFRKGGPVNAGYRKKLIIGLDANSNMFGRLKHSWKEQYIKDLERMRVGGKLKFTKIRNADGTVVSSDILDDIIWFTDTCKHYIDGTKTVIDIRKFPLTSGKQAQLKKYLLFSDHLPVKADFTIDEQNKPSCDPF